MDELLEEAPVINFNSTTLKISGDDSGNENIISSTSATYSNAENISATSGSKISSFELNTCTSLVVANQGSTGSTNLVPWWNENIDDFFSNRSGLVEEAIEDCKKLVLCDEDEDFIGAWLLTEISCWDTEKERLVVLSSKAIVTIKYDFIAVKLLDHNRVLLSTIDTIIVGGLEYPSSSLMPRMNGLVSGVSGVVHGCVVQPLHEKFAASSQQHQQEDFIKNNPFQYSNFEPRTRNINGVRAMWNCGKDLSFLKKWNPFTKVPWVTFTSHPLLCCKGIIDDKRQKMYRVEEFSECLIDTVRKLNLHSSPCNIEHRPILLENYINLPSLIHNKNSLGFFKVRGKFSF